MEQTILIIEDDPDIADVVEINLRDANYAIERAVDGEEGLRKALHNDYSLIILDLMLPKIDGLEVCKRLREQRKNLPILILTSKSEEMDTVLGLELGADDYLTKPFSVRELVARIKAILRRVHAVQEQADTDTRNAPLVFGDLTVDLDKRKVVWQGQMVELTAKEFDLLAVFASNPGRAYTREQLLNMVWGYQYTGYEHTVNTHINRLRAKIEHDPAQPRYITTVWGVGYRFADPEELAL